MTRGRAGQNPRSPNRSGFHRGLNPRSLRRNLPSTGYSDFGDTDRSALLRQPLAGLPGPTASFAIGHQWHFDDRAPIQRRDRDGFSPSSPHRGCAHQARAESSTRDVARQRATPRIRRNGWKTLECNALRRPEKANSEPTPGAGSLFDRTGRSDAAIGYGWIVTGMRFPITAVDDGAFWSSRTNDVKIVSPAKPGTFGMLMRGM